MYGQDERLGTSLGLGILPTHLSFLFFVLLVSRIDGIMQCAV